MSTIQSSRCVPGPGMRLPVRSRALQRRPLAAIRRLAPRLTIDADDAGAVAAAGTINAAQRRVLHVDADLAAAGMLANLLVPEAQVIHAATLTQARRLLQTDVFSLVVLDPELPDGDARTLLPLLAGTPLLLHATLEPLWREQRAPFLPKPWTTSRSLFGAVAGLLGITSIVCAGD